MTMGIDRLKMGLAGLASRQARRPDWMTGTDSRLVQFFFISLRYCPLTDGDIHGLTGVGWAKEVIHDRASKREKSEKST